MGEVDQLGHGGRGEGGGEHRGGGPEALTVPALGQAPGHDAHDQQRPGEHERGQRRRRLQHQRQQQAEPAGPGVCAPEPGAADAHEQEGQEHAGKAGGGQPHLVERELRDQDLFLGEGRGRARAAPHQIEQHPRHGQDQGDRGGASGGGEPAEFLVAEGAPEGPVQEIAIGDQDQPADQPRIGDHHPAQEVVIDGVGALARQGLRGQQATRGGEDLVAHVLDAAELQCLGRGARGMVVELASDEGVVEAGIAEVAGHREIRAVRHMRIDEAGQGAGGGVGRRSLEQADHGAVALAGLEHDGAAAGALRLHVEHRADAAG